MKLQKIKLGFTLIELLVVITIIGILATGAVWVYTSQIQKARDTTRITDMSALKGGLEQAFQDMGMYPWNEATTTASTVVCDPTSTKTNSSVHCVVQLWFLNALPNDPKSGRAGNGSPLLYTYNVGDSNWVENQQYEISTGVEADWFKTSKAANSADWWNDANRIEFWIPWVNINTCIAWEAACTWNSTNVVPASLTSCASHFWVVMVTWACK